MPKPQLVWQGKVDTERADQWRVVVTKQGHVVVERLTEGSMGEEQWESQHESYEQPSAWSMQALYACVKHHANLSDLVKELRTPGQVPLSALQQVHLALSTIMDKAPGYDWNADPNNLTRLAGEAFALVEKLTGLHTEATATDG